jgi:hypothetical protein
MIVGPAIFGSVSRDSKGLRRHFLPAAASSRGLLLKARWIASRLSGALSSRWYEINEAANADNFAPFADGFLPTLTVRAREQDPREPIPNSAWSFGTCEQDGAPTPDERFLLPDDADSLVTTAESEGVRNAP